MGRARTPPVSCARCYRSDICSAVILQERVCRACLLRFRRAPAPCPGCGQVKVLAFYDQARQPACAACTGNRAVYACPGCGREDNPFGTRCGPCTLTVRLTALLADPTGHVHPQLRPVFDTLNDGPRSQTTLYWLGRASSRPDILQGMARGDIPISHRAFDDLPANRATGYLRDLLAALEVIPAYQPALERITPWQADLLAGLGKEHADLLERYTRWQLLRRLRILGTGDHGRRVTRGGVQQARASILAISRFLRWLDTHHLALADLTQTDLERYLQQVPGRAALLHPFLDWTARSNITGHLNIPARQSAAPEVALSDAARWEHVEQLLHDDTIRLYVRIAGLFTLLWAQPLSRVCRMRADQITRHQDGTLTVDFGHAPLELPEPLDQLVAEHLTRRGQASYLSQPDQWLFPGGIPGRHLATENIRSQLVAHGIQPSHARKAAMFGLATQVPAPILGELLNISTKTAARWAVLAARDWSQYISMRTASQPANSTRTPRASGSQ